MSAFEIYGRCIFSKEIKLKDKTEKEAVSYFNKHKELLMPGLYKYPKITYQLNELYDDFNRLIKSNIVVIEEKINEPNEDDYYIVIMQGNNILNKYEFSKLFDKPSLTVHLKGKFNNVYSHFNVHAEDVNGDVIAGTYVQANIINGDVQGDSVNTNAINGDVYARQFIELKNDIKV